MASQVAHFGVKLLKMANAKGNPQMEKAWCYLTDLILSFQTYMTYFLHVKMFS